MKIEFFPGNRIIDFNEGETVLDIGRKASIPIEASCGEKGTCGRCRVKILRGSHPEVSEEESRFFSIDEQKTGWRLACRLVGTDGMQVELPESDSQTDRKKDLLWLPENFLTERNEESRLLKGYGVAFDIGTTTIVGVLWNLSTGEMVDTAARTNPQSVYGSDVISRILFSMQEDENTAVLQKLVIDCMEEILSQFIAKDQVSGDNIVAGTVVGNTTMTHLLLGVDASSLASAPYLPGYEGPVVVSAKAMGLSMAEDANLKILPNIAGHVGADIVGVLIASDLKHLDGSNLAIDIGTNGEILLAKDGRVLTCSTAAGPAFEGASIRHGMRASTGAIEKVRIVNEDVNLTVIGDAEPIGLCGSGLIDAVAELLSAGMISKTGRLMTKEAGEKSKVPKLLVDRLKRDEYGDAFLLFRRQDGTEISLYQKDIREVQLAKGAVAAGIRIMMKELDIATADLTRVLIAGAFGNYIDKLSALTIGLLPDVDPSIVRSIGNGAGTGASMALLSPEMWDFGTRLAEDTEHIDLASHKEFQTVFLNEMSFMVVK